MRGVFALLLFASLGASGARAQCLNYEPSVVTLQGVVSLKLFYGPPNFGENPKTDAKDPQYLLTLDTPMCVDADGKADSLDNYSETGVTLVQLVVGTAQLRRTVKRLLGHRIEVSGKLYHAHTAHHRTNVLLMLERARDAV